MKAAVCTAYESIEQKDVPTPSPGENEVVVNVKSAGVCGSDVDGLYGKHPMIVPPIILGHECAGVIADTGENVDSAREGEPVIVEPFFVCEQCRYCREGAYNLCLSLNIIGHQVDGAFAEYVRIPSRFAHPKPETIGFEEAAVMEPCTGALHAVRRCGIQAGDRVVVLGCGTMGLFAVQHCVNLGASVLISEPDQFKRNLAEDFGAEGTCDPGDGNLTEWVQEMTEGDMADCVIEAAGSEETMRESVELARNGGTIMLIGWTGNTTDAFDLTNTTLRELRVLGTLGFANEFPRSIRLAASGKVNLRAMITHRYELETTHTAIDHLASGESGHLKSVINVS